MSTTFREFLTEKAVGKKPEYTKLDVAQAVKLLNSRCKDALWMLKMNKPLYRGDPSLSGSVLKSGFATVDPSKTERKSQNTKNYYTIILDNNPLMKGFPKRSRSFICSTSYKQAEIYSGWNEPPEIIIPFDGVKIGCVNRKDMWETRIKLFGESGEIHELNDYNWEELDGYGLLKSYDNWKKLDVLLKNHDEKALDYFAHAFPRYKGSTDNFLNDVNIAYSPEKTGWTVHTTADLPRILKNVEVWVGGPCMVITEEMWAELREAI